MGKSRHRTRLGGVLCLLVYLLGGAGILPGLVSVAAYLEGSHQVIVSEAAGEFQMRLRHDADEASAPAIPLRHRHGTVAQLLCTLSRPGDQTPDHVVEIPTTFLSESTTRAGERISTRISRADGTTALKYPAEPVYTWSVPGWGCHSAHAPSRVPDSLSLLRTTVLLI